MKKRSLIFVVLAIFTLTSCGNLLPQSRARSSNIEETSEETIISASEGQSSSKKSSSSSSHFESSVYQHVHTYDDFWSADDTYHWHNANCEHQDLRIDQELHTYCEPYDEVPATCGTMGSYKIRCTVCNFEKVIATDFSDNHDWAVEKLIQPTREEDGYRYYKCRICGQETFDVLYYGETIETALTVDEALAIGEPLLSKEKTDTSYHIKGRVSEIVRLYADNTKATFWLASSNAVRGFECYGIAPDSSVDLSTLEVGAEVVVFGQIYRYNTTLELTTGSTLLSIVNMPTAITSLSFGIDEISLPTGTSRYLDLTYLPYYATPTVSWKLSDATVIDFNSDNKKVSGLCDGKCVVTAFVDSNQNGQVDDSEVSASVTVDVLTPDYFYDSGMLGYSDQNSISNNQVSECTVGQVDFIFSDVCALTSLHGCMRLEKYGFIRASNFPSTIKKIVIEGYPYSNNTSYQNQLSLYAGVNSTCLEERPVSSQNGVFVFNLEDDIRAFAIQNNSDGLAYVNSISVYVDYEESYANPNGTFSGAINLNDGTQTYACIALGETTAYVRIGNETYLTTYSYDNIYHKVTLIIDDYYGTFTAIYKESRNMLALGRLTGPASSYLAENGQIYLNGQIWLADCNGNDSELQSLFKRRYRDSAGGQWVIDSIHEDRLTSYTDGINGSAVQWRPWNDGAVALNLAEDFVTPIQCSHFGYWVYNPSDNDITLRMWMYKDQNHNLSVEIEKHVAKAKQWTYYYGSFNELMTYNFQIADFSNSGVALIFDNISFSY